MRTSIIITKMVRSCKEGITIGYNTEGDGEEWLNNFAASNPLDYWESHPGYYYTTAPFMNMENPLAYMIYWVENEHFFQASVPTELLEEFWTYKDSLMIEYDLKE